MNADERRFLVTARPPRWYGPRMANVLHEGKWLARTLAPPKQAACWGVGARLLTSHREGVWCVYYPNMLPLICVHLRVSAVEFSIGSRNLTPDGRRFLAVSFGCGSAALCSLRSLRFNRISVPRRWIDKIVADFAAALRQY